jgi:uncharacterized protein YyaL (SSP411 family)
MLHSQAQLLRVYTQAYYLLGEQRYESIVAGIVSFLDRELTSPTGGYYSAIDADSPGGEGLFYVWTLAELEAALNPAQLKFAIDQYNVVPGGNFDGANVLHITQSAEALARKHQLPFEEYKEYNEQIQRKLLEVCAARIRPLRDEKIVIAWNAMTITALGEAAVIFDKPAYLTRAIAVAEHLLSRHLTDAGRLLRSTYHDLGGVPAIAADYAALIESLLVLYDATRDERYIEDAKRLQKTLQTDFWDDQDGGYFMRAKADKSVATGRPKSISDDALSSGNAIALAALAGLKVRTAGFSLDRQADELVAAIGGDILRCPSAHSYALRAVVNLHNGERDRTVSAKCHLS